ncbi:hypothetical protein FSP39_011826 [Pinctada imbricata]|uniref:Uncharacterized protein n=1 Tax=Pinctada imbricata TaxID=66713 RepID=A0AA89BR16_PINIB|nr:hypothetical protein FSP39_011826 [Pinctada imbricata]
MKNTEQTSIRIDAKGTRNVNVQHRNIKHKGLHINQRDQWATGAELGRPSAMEITEGVSILEERKRKSVVKHQRGLEEAVSRIKEKRALVISGRKGCWKNYFSEDLINRLLDDKIVSKAALIESKQDWNAFLQLTGSKCAYLKSEEMVQTRDWLSFTNEYNSEEMFLIIVHGVEVYDIKHYEDNFDSIINLAFSEFELTIDERKIAITDACRLKNHEIDESIENAVEIETKEGFLETLNEYFSNTNILKWCTLTDYFSNIVPRLKQPNAIYLSTTAKHDLEFFLLAFCYLSASDIDISVLYNPNNKDTIHRFVNLEGHARMSSYEEIASTRHKLMKYNLRTGKTDMLAMYGEKYPQYYIEYSVNSEFFIEHTGSETSNVQVYVMIPKRYWYKFVQRLVDMLGKEKCKTYLEDHDPDLIPYITTEFPPEKERFDLVDVSRDM